MDLAAWFGPVNSGLALLIVTMLLRNLQNFQLVQTFVARQLSRRARRLAALIDPYLSITIHEYDAGRMTRSDVFAETKAYLDGAVGSRDDCHRDLVRAAYLPHVRDQGRAFMAQSRQRKLYTNIPSSRWGDDGSYMCSLWTEVPFKHPKTFETLAMDPAKKEEIIEDLDMFRNGKEQHARVGKAWKRGYLLYGPPGTGKSTMVAAMANYLGYDVYDMELTSVHTNTDLRKLLIQTTCRSIIVIEDVDCSSNLTGRRKATDDDDDGGGGDAKASKKVIDRGGGGGGDSKVTLSGLLNFIDGLWSAFGEERLIVLTTNHIEDLDPALIRTGRMDKKIEMSYCDFETFKSMAKIHLDVDDHGMFAAVKELLQEVDLVPADVGEHLTAKNPRDDVDSCLARLVTALQEAKAKMDAAERQDEDNGVVV
uniref:AAA+ ATPase domain-containing protein n=1 Tax=Oryza brachyantha TaxID=4533 RepID=J3LTT7_ORYBR